MRLLHYSLSLSSTPELDQVSQSLEKTGHELYRRACESLKQDAAPDAFSRQQFTAATQRQLAARGPGVFLERRSRKLHLAATRATAWIIWCGTATASRCILLR